MSDTDYFADFSSDPIVSTSLGGSSPSYSSELADWLTNRAVSPPNLHPPMSPLLLSNSDLTPPHPETSTTLFQLDTSPQNSNMQILDTNIPSQNIQISATTSTQADSDNNDQTPVLMPTVDLIEQQSTTEEPFLLSTVELIDDSPSTSGQIEKKSTETQTDERDMMRQLADTMPYFWLGRAFDRTYKESRSKRCHEPEIKGERFKYTPHHEYPSSKSLINYCPICMKDVKIEKSGGIARHIQSVHFKGDSAFSVTLIQAVQTWLQMAQFVSYQHSSCQNTQDVWNSIISIASDITRHKAYFNKSAKDDMAEEVERLMGENDQDENAPPAAKKSRRS